MRTANPVLMIEALSCLMCAAVFASGKAQPQKTATSGAAKDCKGAFVHATYVRGKYLKSRDQLDHTRFDQFDVMYLVAGPDWKAKDFELPETEVFRKLVKEHTYPTGDSGESLVPEFIDRAHRKKVKVLVSIPGSFGRHPDFKPVAQDSRKRALFARVMAAFVKKYNYDGIEIDWEHTVDLSQHAALMADLREALDALEKSSESSSRRYLLTTALHSWRKYTPDQARQLSRCVDWINVMTYDMGGGLWGRTPRHNTPLNKIKRNMDRWSAFSPKKICIGLASYGYIYRGISPGQESQVSLRKKGWWFSYTQLPALLQAGWKESYDPKAEAPYYFSPDGRDFVTIDNKRSLDRKMEWVFEKQFRGVFWWEFHCDYFPPTKGQKYARHPLIDHVADRIRTWKSVPLNEEEKHCTFPLTHQGK